MDNATISATDPISRAIAHTRRVLFEPFELMKWLVIGFAAFLASLGAGGGSGLNWPGETPKPTRGGGPPDAVAEVMDWIVANTGLVAVIVVGALVVIGALMVLFLWLASRGKFVFLDDVAMNRGLLVEPWKRFRREANALLVAEVTLGLIGLLGVVAALVGGLVLLWDDLRSWQFGAGALGGAILFASVVLSLALVIGAIRWLLHDFGVPVMIVRGGSAWAALAVVWRELVKQHTGAVLVYALLRALAAFAFGIIVLILSVCTCCVAALPYVNSVVTLPYTVFVRAWSLYFIEQLGPEWKLIASPPEPPYPAPGDRWG